MFRRVQYSSVPVYNLKKKKKKRGSVKGELKARKTTRVYSARGLVTTVAEGCQGQSFVVRRLCDQDYDRRKLPMRVMRVVCSPG